MNKNRRWELMEPATVAQKQSRAVIQHTLVEMKRDLLQTVRDSAELAACLERALKLLSDEPLPSDDCAFLAHAKQILEKHKWLTR